MKLRNSKWFSTLLGFSALMAVGCAREDAPDQKPIVEQLEGTLTLEEFSSCGDLEGYMKDIHKDAIELAFEQMKNGNYYGYYDEVMPGLDVAFAEDGQALGGGGGTAEPAPNDGGFDLPKGYTGTNNQEGAVDEGDIVKTDGAFIYILRNHSLLITSAFPADEVDVVSTTDLEGTPIHMFQQDDTLVVFSNLYTWNMDTDALGFAQDSLKGNNLVKATLFDITDRANPKKVREVYTEGSYVSSRLHNESARVVLRTPSLLEGKFGYGYYGGGFVDTPVSVGVAVDVAEPGDWREDEEFTEDAPVPLPAPAPEADSDSEDSSEPQPGKADIIDDALAELEQQTYEEWLEKQKNAMLTAIDGATIKDLSPRAWEITYTDDGTATPIKESLLSDCDHHFKPSVDAGLDMLSILTIDMTNPADSKGGSTILGEAGHVYASGNAIYVASDLFNGWLGQQPDAQEDWQLTAIHKFDISSSADEVIYAGSGKVPGSVLNQFSLSEYEGNLRVATTKWAWNGEEQFSYVTVLSPEGDKLTQIGQTEGLAEGEEIYSARFVGDKGYVVTFEQIDPLFTIDLSDPANPTVVGELKIPGFSTYIHPLDENHLLTIGQHTDNANGWTSIQGLQLTIFDVSDIANPIQAHKTILDSGLYSEALYEHKAFSYDAASGKLSIPLNGWGNAASTVIGSGGGTSTAPVADCEMILCEEIPECCEGEWIEECEWIVEDFCSEQSESWGNDYYEEYINGLAVFDIDLEEGVTQHGFIDHTDLSDQSEYGYYYNDQVRRSLFMGDYLFSIGTIGMKVSLTEDLSAIASLSFPEENYNEGPWKEEPAVEGIVLETETEDEPAVDFDTSTPSDG